MNLPVTGQFPGYRPRRLRRSPALRQWVRETSLSPGHLVLPLFVRPALYFFYRFVLRRGFLDGKEGFIFHFLQGFWYRLLVDIHLDDMLRATETSPEQDKW